VAEQVLLLENIATAVKAGPTQLQTLHALLLEAVSARARASWRAAGGCACCWH
jgi:hypothetical protein